MHLYHTEAPEALLFLRRPMWVEEEFCCFRLCVELLELARDGEARCRTDCVPEGQIFGYDARGSATQ
jgi:hypothetical protein